MTYFQSLLIFIGPVLVVLIGLVIRWKIADSRKIAGLLVNVGLALVYTTPWDNYLVATNVWWYNTTQVTGITLGYVPIEEYTFFIVQTLSTGLLLLVVLDRIGEINKIMRPDNKLRIWSAGLVAGIGLISLVVFISGWSPGRYAALILAWASFPLVLQLAFGADILWARKRSLLFTIISMTIYLWVMDALSISSGIWTIDPNQTTGIKIWTLPVEEMLFFLVTNILVSFGLLLFISDESVTRIVQFRKALKKPD